MLSQFKKSREQALLITLAWIISGCGQNAHFKDPSTVTNGAESTPTQRTVGSGSGESSQNNPKTDPGSLTPVELPPGASGPTGSVTPKPQPPIVNFAGSRPLSDQEVCKLVASLLDQAYSAGAKDTQPSTWEVLEDGTCVVKSGQLEQRYAPGTTLEIEIFGDNVVHYILRDAGGRTTQAYYASENRVIVIVYQQITIPAPEPSSTPSSTPTPSTPAPQPIQKIELAGQFHFDTGKYVIKNPDHPLVQALARMIQDVVRTQKDLIKNIVIEGHTDDEKPAPGTISNKELSIRRATAVRKAVLQILHASPDESAKYWDSLILAQGFGDSQPIAGPNGRTKSGKTFFTKADREQNRRVEFTVQYKQ